MNERETALTFQMRHLIEKSSELQKKSVSQNTKIAYERDWNDFYKFCSLHDIDSFPAKSKTVALYLTDLAERNLAIATIVRRVTSISAMHRAAKFQNPTRDDEVYRVLSGIKRTYGCAQKKAKSISWSDLQTMIYQCDSLMIGVRDAAILSIGWACALRRSELVSLDVQDVEISDQGMIVTIRRSKTDQDGEGVKIGVPRAKCFCPVSFVERWIERAKPWLSGIESSEQFLFPKLGIAARGKWWWPPCQKRLDARMVSQIVKRYARLAGWDPEIYSAHSLRRGLATEAGARGVPERVISRHTRHRSTRTLRGYIDDGSIWAENPLHAVYSGSSSSGDQDG